MADPRLIIVRRGHLATYELLTRTFGDDPTVQVIWDRRIGERRQSTDRPPGDRRRSDRRALPPAQWRQLHYMANF